ncbi:hypothetical protein [Petropleomorpha daqingensis]|uniref:ATP-dependent endonuclease n=1 Tax=Petropleomorpha daqingensis TaxID=2026353 RepID=A0A853CMM6_9ACTN|nr:hypothetical protein [Petropleomorpha daqingensis]NYJ07243.1 hypothetical protein [Petropleomorpha daqingensis]
MPAVVLLEGRSDVAAVRAVATTSGLPPDAYRLVDMGGVTNIRRQLASLGGEQVLGMCDAGEAHVVARALRIGEEELAEHGFSVCDADLEDELIRACGHDRVLDVLDRLGLGERFATFRNQPTWRGRPLGDQLHRFAGTTSGRKSLFAAALAAELVPDQVPEPLSRLLERIAEAARRTSAHAVSIATTPAGRASPSAKPPRAR